MTNGADLGSGDARSGALPIAAAFAALLALVAGELVVVGLAAEPATRITALAGLLMAKVGVVMSFFMRVRQSRRASWLVLAAIGFGAGIAVVLMLETAYRVGVR